MNASEVVPLTHGVQLYLLDRTDSGASFQAQCLVILARAGGFLLGVPVDTFSTAELKHGQSASPDELIGPSTEVTVGALARAESGAETQLGRQISVTLVDVREEAAALLLPMDLEEEPEFLHTFDMDAPEALPVFQELIDAARAWIAAGDAQERVLFYSAEEGEPSAHVPPAKKAAKAAAPAKAKRPTTALLSGQVQVLESLLPALTSQLESLAARQAAMEEVLAKRPQASVSAPPPAQQPALHQPAQHLPMSASLAQPLGAAVSPPVGGLAAAVGVLGPPPRTRQAQVLKDQPATAAGLPELLAEEAEEGLGRERSDPLSQAVLAQSNALTALVAQLAAQSGDTFPDLTGVPGGSAASRGATQRARLQEELAMGSGAFYTAVTQNMLRRMQPATPVASADLASLHKQGVNMCTYLERFGGFAQTRELGLIAWLVGVIFDLLQADQVEACKDRVALLLVLLEQGAMDAGRLDIAYLLTLAEDPPIGLFTNKTVLSTSRARSFAPLASQKWVTTALAFLREMDLIQSKRQELGGGGVGGRQVPKDPSTASGSAAGSDEQNLSGKRRHPRAPKKKASPQTG